MRESGLLCARPPLCHAPLCLVTFHVCPHAILLPFRVTNGSFGLHFFCVFIVPCHQDRLCPPRCLSRRQRPCVLKGVLQMATLFAVCCIHAPWVWSLIVSVRSSWSLAMSPPDFVISFFAVVKQTSCACLGQGHTRYPHVGFSRSQFSHFACESSHAPVPGQADMRNCLVRLRHLWGHMMSHRRRELRLHRARHLWASALARTRKH